MSDLPKMLKELKYDKRMLNWNLRQNLLTKKEHEEHLNRLPDLSHLKEEVKLEEEKTSEDTTADESDNITDGEK